MSIKSIFLNFFLSLGLLCVSFYIAWQVSASTNFFYSFWYEAINLDQAIKTYAPKNKNKQGFELTNKKQHVELFSGIVSSIQNKGNGLENLNYQDSNNKVVDTLLTKAEIIHLQDVANLISRFKYLLIAGGLMVLISFVLLKVTSSKLAKLRYNLLGLIGLIVTIVIILFIAGPTKVFYAAHEIIFPDNHQWFFYYEDSLMSTMMKAPVLFGPIAGQLLITTIIIWLFLYLGILKVNDWKN